MKYNFDVEPGGVMGNISSSCIEPTGPVYDGKHASVPSINTKPIGHELNDDGVNSLESKWGVLTQAFLDQKPNGGGVTGFLLN